MRNAAAALFSFVLIFSPLAFGATEPWSWLVMEVAAFAALTLYGLHCHLQGGVWYRVPATTPLFLLLGYLTLQIVPLPAGLVALLAPRTYAAYQETLGQLGPLPWLTLSLNTKATIGELWRYSAYVACYLVAVQLLADKDALRTLVRRVVFLGAGIAFYMLLFSFVPTTKIYWLREVGIVPTGPYVNHNHFANLMAMLLPLAIVLFMYARPRMHYEKTLREKVVAFFTYRKMSEYLYLGLAALLIGASIFLSLSRGGMTSSCLSVLLLFLAFFRRERRDKRSALLWGVVIAAAIVLSVEWWLGWQQIFTRFGRLQSADGGLYELRFDYWQDTLRIIRDFWITGAGFGAFVDIYPAYRTIPGTMVLDHAHQDYLELLVEGGMVGMLLVGWFWVALFRQNLRVIRQRHERFSFYLFWGSTAGIVAFMLHGFSDFSFHLGANGLYLFFLAALSVAAAHTRLRPGLAPSHLPVVPTPRFARIYPMVPVLLALLAGTFQAGLVSGRLRSEPLVGLLLDESMSHEALTALKGQAQQAVQADPLEGRYWFALANLEAALYDNQATRAHYRQALRRNPTKGIYLQQLALAEASLGEIQRAEQLFKASIRYERGEPQRYFTYAGWLWENGRKGEGLAQMRQALALEGTPFDTAIALMVQHGLTDVEMEQAMPLRVGPNLRLADYYNTTKKLEQAARLYERALDFVAQEPTLRPGHFQKPYWFFMKRGQFDKALAVMRLASQYLPQEAAIAVNAGQAYEKMGLDYRAVEEYERALTIDRSNQAAQRALLRLRGKPNR